MATQPAPLVVVAVGGNALATGEHDGGAPAGSRSVAAVAGQLAGLVASGLNVVLVHGNGPQVGLALRRSELALPEVPAVTMDAATADTQGSIGYLFQRALESEFRARGLERRAVTVVTQVVVDRDDPAFHAPTKPIGSFLDEAQARELAAAQGWTVAEDAGRGWRRVVPSPEPVETVEVGAVAHLLHGGFVVIASGGGGIPVVREPDGRLVGVEAVVDKDHSASLLARELRADVLLISTAVPGVALDFGKPAQRWLDRVTEAELAAYHAEGHFAPGSMEPKVRAVLAFLRAGGKRAVVTDLDLADALAGRAGTTVVPDPARVARSTSLR